MDDDDDKIIPFPVVYRRTEDVPPLPPGRGRDAALDPLGLDRRECGLRLARRLGLRGLRWLPGTQNLVARCRYRRRTVVAKLRLAGFAKRLHKERGWLRRAAGRGMRVPPVLDMLDHHDGCALLLPPIPRRRRRDDPASWRELLRPLGMVPPRLEGWGFLRADDVPRWQTRQEAAAWYRELVPDEAEPDARKLVDEFFAAAVPRLIHGDAHPGNRIGDTLIDFEHVAVGDPALDAARLALSSPRSLDAWAERWGLKPLHPRWRGALFVTALEVLTHGGPGRRRARGLAERVTGGAGFPDRPAAG